ncbi:MAG: zinc ribbon domain-containing protein [Candidatus Omnitrophota bacterium]
MPTYEYQCTKCDYKFEVFQKMDAAPKKRCPECKSEVRKLISGGCGLIFKGSGFYATDYKKKDASADKAKERSLKEPSKEPSKDKPDSKAKEEKVKENKPAK